MDVDPAPATPQSATAEPSAAPKPRRDAARGFVPAAAAVDDSDDEEVDEETILSRTMRKVFDRKDEALDDPFYKDPETGERSKYTKRMYKLVQLLSTNKGLKMLKNSVRVNMRFKVKKYMKMRKTIEESRAIEKLKYDRMEEGIRDGGNLEDDSDNWHIYDKIGNQLLEFDRQIGALMVVEDRARQLLNEDNLDTDGIEVDNTTIRARRSNLLQALNRLAFYNQQTMILEAVSEIVYGFLINPAFVRRKFMNFLMAGPAGTGKTSIVREIASVFAAAGIFVYNTVVEGGRNEFIAPYEGQTVGKTMSFLTAGLDSGVIFVDEAYSVTNWDKGIVSSYGAEATAAMVDFMTKYKGLYCLMFAGYEKEMRRYFLEANEGLPRRIPYQYRLKDYNPAQLVQIYKRTLLTEMGLPDNLLNDDAIAYIESAFTREAWVWLSKFVTYAREHKKWYYKKPQYDEKTKKYYEREIKIIPQRKYIWEIFKNQAGAMTNLAEATVVALVNTVEPEEITLADVGDDDSSMQVDQGGSGSGQAGTSASDRAFAKVARALNPADPAGATDTATDPATDPATDTAVDAGKTPDPTNKPRTTNDLESTRNARFTFKRGNPVNVLRFLIKDRIMNTFMSEAPLFLEEFEKVDQLANIATEAYFKEQVQKSQMTSEDYVDKTYYNADATIDVATEEVDDEPYQVLERPVLTKKKGKGGMPGLGGGAAGKPKVVPLKDMIQVKYCAGSYFHQKYLEEFKGKLDQRSGGWWDKGNHKTLIAKISAAIQDAYTIYDHSDRTKPMTLSERKKLIGGDGKTAVPQKGFTLSEPVEYANTGYGLDTYLIYVDENLDVELTLVYKKNSTGSYFSPKYQLRLINKAGFDPTATGPNVVYSVGIPFAAFRLETKEHLLTRILSIGEEYKPDHAAMIKLFQKMVDSGLDEMAGAYILVANTSDETSKYGMTLPSTRMSAPERGLLRKTAFGDNDVPYAWVTEDGRQTPKDTQNAVKGKLTPPMKAVATRSKGSVADADAEMPAAADVPQDDKGPTTRGKGKA